MTESFFEDSVEYAKKILLEEGDFFPVFIANTRDGKCFVIATPWENEKQKELTVNYVRMLFAKEDVHEYCFMTEMWFKSVASIEERPKGFICDQPDKQEGLIVIYVKVDNGKITRKSAIFETIRTNGLELNSIPGGEVNGGTFAEMLSPRTDLTPEIRSKIGDVLEAYEKTLGFKIQRQEMKNAKH